MDKTQKLIAEALELTAGKLTDLAEEAETSRQALYSWAAGDRTPSTKKLANLYFSLAVRAGRLEQIVDELSEVLLDRSPGHVRQLVDAARRFRAGGVEPQRLREAAELWVRAAEETNPPEEGE